MAFDGFIKIDGIPGESSDAKHKDYIEVLTFTHAMEQPASSTASSSGGATAERVNHKPFVFEHQIDKASPLIYEACCKGTHVKEVEFVLCRAGGDKVEYFKTKFEQALITKVEPKGTANADGFPSELVYLSYGKIAWEYLQQKREDGTSSGSVATGWDLTANAPV